MHRHIFAFIPAYVNINSIAFISRMMPRVMVEYLAKTLADMFDHQGTLLQVYFGILNFSFSVVKLNFKLSDI